MGEMLNEDRMTLTELARQEGVNICTVWRWANRGVRGAKLETFSVGGRRYTTKQAKARFAEACTAAALGQAPPSRTNRQRDAAVKRAEAKLSKAGI